VGEAQQTQETIRTPGAEAAAPARVKTEKEKAAAFEKMLDESQVSLCRRAAYTAVEKSDRKGVSGGRSLTGGRYATPADSPLHDGTPYDVGVWYLSIVQGSFSVAPCQTL
jgi:hypothetical protein